MCCVYPQATATAVCVSHIVLRGWSTGTPPGPGPAHTVWPTAPSRPPLSPSLFRVEGSGVLPRVYSTQSNAARKPIRLYAIWFQRLEDRLRKARTGHRSACRLGPSGSHQASLCMPYWLRKRCVQLNTRLARNATLRLNECRQAHECCLCAQPHSSWAAAGSWHPGAAAVLWARPRPAQGCR